MVLLDLMLPRVDAFEVLTRIGAEERARRVPVVILTSSSEDRNLSNGHDLDANSDVRKPVRPEKFATAIAQLGVYWLLITNHHRTEWQRTPNGATPSPATGYSSRGPTRGPWRAATLRRAPPTTSRSCWTVAVPQPRRETTDASLYLIDDLESEIDAIERELRSAGAH